MISNGVFVDDIAFLLDKIQLIGIEQLGWIYNKLSSLYKTVSQQYLLFSAYSKLT